MIWTVLRLLFDFAFFAGLAYLSWVLGRIVEKPWERRLAKVLAAVWGLFAVVFTVGVIVGLAIHGSDYLKGW